MSGMEDDTDLKQVLRDMAIECVIIAKKLGLEGKTIQKIEQLSSFIDIDDGDHPFYMIALLVKICKAIGEFIDLLGQSDASYFGFKHNSSTRLNGKKHPIQKIIDELRAILTDPTDNKYAKRQERFDFFNAFAPDNHDIANCFDLIFSEMCDYLNGGETGETPMGIVITASGGNLITIYAQLVEYYLELTSEPKEKNSEFDAIISAFDPKLSKFKSELRSYVNSIKVTAYDAAKERTISLKEQIIIMAKKPYSDLDYKIGANFDPDRPPLDDRVDLSEQVQFSLARAKIEKLCKKTVELFGNIEQLCKKIPSTFPRRPTDEQLQTIRKQNETRWKKSCLDIAEIKPHIIDTSTINGLYPAQMKEEYLTNLELELNILENESEFDLIIQNMISNYTATSDSVDGKSLQEQEQVKQMKRCLKYLLSLSIIKDANDKATATNITTMSNLYTYTVNDKKVSTTDVEKYKKNNTTQLIKKKKIIQETEESIKKIETTLKELSTKKTTSRTQKTTDSDMANLRVDLDRLKQSLIQERSNVERILADIPSPRKQLVKLIRRISIASNAAISELLSRYNCSYKQIDECFETMHTMMTVPIGSSELTVIELQTKVLSKLLINSDIIGIEDIMSAIAQSDANTTLGASTATTNFSHVSNDPEYYEDQIMQNIHTILKEVPEHRQEGIRALVIVLGNNPDNDSGSTIDSQTSHSPSMLSQDLTGAEVEYLAQAKDLAEADSGHYTSSRVLYIPFLEDNLTRYAKMSEGSSQGSSQSGQSGQSRLSRLSRLSSIHSISERSSQGSSQSRLSSIHSISNADELVEEFIEALWKYKYGSKQEDKASPEPPNKLGKRREISVISGVRDVGGLISNLAKQYGRSTRTKMHIESMDQEGGAALKYKDNIKLSTKKKKVGSNKIKKPKKSRKARKSRKSRKSKKPKKSRKVNKDKKSRKVRKVNKSRKVRKVNKSRKARKVRKVNKSRKYKV